MVRSWKRLKTINILGIEWTIKKCPRLGDIKKDKSAWGTCLSNRRLIKLYSRIPTEDDYRQVLLHEIDHAIVGELSPTLKALFLVQMGRETKDSLQSLIETILRLLCQVRYQVLKDSGLFA